MTTDLHAQLIVVDGLQYSNFFGTRQSDVLSFGPQRQLFDQWRMGGLTCVHVTVAIWEDARTTLDAIGRWYRVFGMFGDLVGPVRSVADIRSAKESNKTAVVLGFQNTSPFEDDLALVEVFYHLGIRVAQLTYNIQNFVGSSCYEPQDSGLSRFGRYLVAEMNRLGMLIDLSHVGERTSLEAIEASAHPVAITHANPYSLYPHKRNKSDKVLKALAETGGVLGCATYPSLMGGSGLSLAKWCDMVASTVDLMGMDHVGVGTDTALDWSLEDAFSMNMGRWSHKPDYGAHSASAPGWAPWPDWYKSPANMLNLTAGLLERGFSKDEVAALMGGNWLRLFTKVFGSS
ncbi:MAG: dipeptidase [Pseudomonadota bacterium]